MIISKIFGGLGNQMFQFAAGLALARKYNVTLKLDLFEILDQSSSKRKYALDIFNYIFPVATKIDVLRHLIPFCLSRYATFFSRKIHFDGRLYFHELSSDFNAIPSTAYIEGYWQNFNFYREIEDELRFIFSLRSELVNYECNLIHQITQSKNPVCVAVRRGDYVGNSEFETVSLEYYFQSLELLKKVISSRQIFVFSDDIDWCERHFNFPNERIIYAKSVSFNNLMVQDFYAMSQCHYFIIPNSTFHFWGAWLAPYKKKIVIAPKIWNRSQTTDIHPIVPAEWITL